MHPVATHDDVNPWSAWLWITVAIIAAIDALWLMLTPISLADASYPVLARMAPMALLMVMGTWTPGPLRTRPRLRAFCVGIGTLSSAWPVLRIYNHLTMSTDFPMADPLLASADGMLGFDWHGYVGWVDRHPWLLKTMSYTYDGLTGYSIALFLLLLASRKQSEQACAEFVKLFVITAITCTTIGMLFPAVSAVIHYALPAGSFHNLAPGTGSYHLAALLELRSNAPVSLDLNNLPGLVTFPSFHTAMGVIAIYCARRNPVLLAFSTAVNGLMIGSTPVFGAHYAIDILGGIVVSGAVILALRRDVVPALPIAVRLRPLRAPAVCS